MKVTFNTEGNILKIHYTPMFTTRDGLLVIYGDMTSDDGMIGKQPAIRHDLNEGQTDYELPPDLDPALISSVEVEDTGNEETIKMW